MLSPPLSLLSDELLASIVEQLAKFSFSDKNLKNLSLADRAFTQSCQKYIFRELILGDRIWSKISKQLTKMKNFLDDKPSFANRVRVVRLNISREKNASLFKDPIFTSILQLFSKSPMPPHELHLVGIRLLGLIFEDPMLVVQQLTNSFFSQTLTILHVSDCWDVPLSIFLICPRLREVFLHQVEAAKSYDNYPDIQFSGREAPLLEVLNYRASHSLVKQMIAPPLKFNTPVVLWSNLRVLTLDHEKEGIACLQPILDAACDTLEELYITRVHVGFAQELSLAGHVNLSNLPNLHVFSLYAFVDCEPPWNAPPFAVTMHDINIVLGTIPEYNRVTNLLFDFEIFGGHSFRGCLGQDWANEIIRIASGKPLELELQMYVETEGLEEYELPGADELYMRIMEKAASLSYYPNICTHLWDPTRAVRPSPRFQVRGRCRR